MQYNLERTKMKQTIVILTATLLVVLGACSVNKNNKNMNKKSVTIQQIRNATLKINYNGSTFLIDPSLSPKSSFMSFVVPDRNLNPTVDLPMSVEEVVKDIDAVLVTHTHLDHFDQGAKDHIDTEIPFYVQPSDDKVFKKSPFSNYTIVDKESNFESTKIIRTDGKHGPDAMLEALGNVSGFVLKADNYPTIYIIGDCLLDEDIKNTIKTHKPDIIIANTGGAQFGGATILMDEKSVVEIAKIAPNAKVVAVHMESLDHCKTTRKMVLDETKENDVKVIVPKDGEILNL